MFSKGSLLLLALILVFAVLIGAAILQPQNNFTCSDCNVIWIDLDPVQAAHLGIYGYSKNTSPNIDAFARNSFTFMDAISPASWTVPSYISYWTSLYPSEHHIINWYYAWDPARNISVVANLRNLTPSAVTLAEIMKQNGYATIGFTGDAGARGASGNNIGFDIYVDKPDGVFSGFNYSMGLAENWLANNSNQKFFMFVQGYDTHGQFALQNFTGKFLDINYTGNYTGNPVEQAALREEGLAYGYVNLTQDDIKFWRALYDEKIYNADQRFGNFINFLDERGLMNNTIVIFTSVHGTEFMEHGRLDHGHTLYQELDHVPMIIYVPNHKGQQVTSRVSTIDVMPTVLQLLDINQNDTLKAQMKGISLIPAFEGKDVSRDIYSETDYRLYTHKRSILTTNGWEFILTLAEYPNKTNVRELYNLQIDPHETMNLVDKYPQIAYELEQKVIAHMNAMGTDVQGPWIIGCSPVYKTQCQ